ncbi:heterokaryon incompatibility protein [Rutstroemia sp. NJR-2017a WRK4]|nr:heterokaryon incompatibility protein [Rutstroemia sp. NJR-2017a WRK4]
MRFRFFAMNLKALRCLPKYPGTRILCVTFIASRAVFQFTIPHGFGLHLGGSLYYKFNPLKEKQGLELWTGSSQSLDVAKVWFASCIQSHSDCLPENLKGFEYPIRLISIGSGILRLVLASEISYRAPYATLSHCWGSLIPLRLVNDNITKLRAGISDSELCKTFNEAILVANNLQLDYIWIDSLCIIQDDPEDWLRESAKMSGVYGCSTINIAATSAKDGTMGCFFKAAQAFRIPRAIRGGSEFWDFALFGPFDAFLCEPLLSRAWVFQERFLAPRTLHFASSQIYWECKEAHKCGMFPKPGQSLRHLGYFTGFPKSIPQRRNSALWENIVEIYSTGMLTNATDRLVAISGVAQWMQAKYKDDYLAGIWRQDMERQLCWQTKHSSSGELFISRPKVYLAPSWSWASILSSIEFMKPDSDILRTETPLIRVLSAHTILENEYHKFGKVAGGALRLVVRYLLCGVEYQKAPFGNICNSSGDPVLYSYRIRWDSPEDPSPRKKLYLLPVNSSCWDSDQSDDDLGFNGRKTNIKQEKNLVSYTVDGIILEATETSKMAEYRRVGSWKSGDVKDLEEKSDDSNELLYEEVEENGTKLRVITII